MNYRSRPYVRIWWVLIAAAVLFTAAFFIESFWHRSVAKELKIQTCAEYVHNQNLLQICTEMGIDFAQGFAIGQPASLT